MTWADWKKAELIKKGKENWDEDDYQAWCYIECCETEDARDKEYLENYSIYF